MKETVGKTKIKENSFPRNLAIGDTKVIEKLLIAKNLNDFCVNIGPKLASVIPNSTKAFQTFLLDINTVLNGTELIEKDFLDAFQSLKNDKSPGFDELHINIIKSVCNKIIACLMRVFRNFIDNGSFPEKMKIAMVTPIFKAVKKELQPLTKYLRLTLVSM